MTNLDEADPTGAAAQLDSGAHALRNDIATLRAAAQVVDDPEIADAIATATADLQQRIERLVVAARIELDRRPSLVTIDAAELVRLGVARARREGATNPSIELQVAPGEVHVPGAWAERLVADLVHGADDGWISGLAQACGATLHALDQGAVRLSFQHASDR